jgi:hypothetical protein
MKNKLLSIVALIAMMFFAVEGYAQRSERSGGSRGHSPRVENRSSSRSSNYARTAPQPRNSSYSRQQAAPSRGSSYQRQGSYQRQSTVNQSRVSRPSSNRQASQVQNTRPRQNGHVAPQRGYQAPHHRPAPPSHHHYGAYRPTFHHHHAHYHHHHNCIFDRWSWYSWQGYHNRFIRHGYYHNRYFDNMLGYYLWGSLNAPTRLDIGNMTFTRYNSTLKIRIGNDYSYLDLYRYQRIVYNVGYTTVEVTTSSGYATIYFYDEYGNTATYRL